MENGAMSENTTYEIRSEARGPHWVAWVARAADGKPSEAVLLVGQTKEEAEDRARRWAARTSERAG
jgi:hypothetical protein